MIELRMAETTVDAIHAFKAYTAMFAEGLVPGVFSAEKTLTNVIRFVNGPDSLVLMAMDGQNCAGVLTLVKCTFWHSEESRFMEDKGLYVLPPYRDGEAFKVLIEAAKQLADDTGLLTLITINNPARKRGSRPGWERIAVTLGFTPRGATLAYTPHHALPQEG